jgi:hypothetical protein
MESFSIEEAIGWIAPAEVLMPFFFWSVGSCWCFSDMLQVLVVLTTLCNLHQILK